MNPNLQKAIEYIEKWEIAAFFEFLKSKVGDHATISRLEKNFIWGKYDADLADQLRLLANQFLSTDKTESEKAKMLLDKTEMGNISIKDSKNFLLNTTIGHVSGDFHIGDKIEKQINVQGNYIENQYITYGEKKIKRHLAPATATAPATFLGRKEELAEIRKRLSIGNTLALINGEGGIGKTSLAAKYWKEYEQAYQHAAWLFCENGILDSLITQLSFPLGIDLKELKTRAEQIHAIRAGMGNLPKDCLLVLDNANQEDEITDFLEEFRGIGWHILFTSRCQKVLQNEYYIEGLPLDLARRHFKVSFCTVFDFAQILHLFEPYNQNQITENDFEQEINALFTKYAPKLAQELPDYLDKFLVAVGYNTLAIEIFAKNLAEFSATGKGFAEFMQRLEQKGGLKLENDEKESYCFQIITDYALNIKRKVRSSDEVIEVLYDLSGLKKTK